MMIVKMLGSFELSYGDVSLTEEQIHSSMLTKLIAYMLIYRDKPLGTKEIIDALYSEEEVDKPEGALKNLMYRLRNLLKATFGDEKYIISNRGSYQWNPEIKVEVDAEQFAELIHSAKNEDKRVESAASLYKKAIALYHGDFMAQHGDVHWVIILASYYHSIFLSCAKELAEVYFAKEYYEDLEVICNEALRYDRVDEQLYYFLILARVRSGKLKIAMESYEKIRGILQDELGIQNSEKLQEAYEEILNANKGKEKAENIDALQDEMTEEDISGTYMCGYPIFRELYRIEKRKAIRLNKISYIVLVSVQPIRLDYDKVNEFRVKSAMDKLETIIHDVLRIGDVATRYNDSQFLILLPACDLTGCEIVTTRIQNGFNKVVSSNSKIMLKMRGEELTSYKLPEKYNGRHSKNLQ